MQKDTMNNWQQIGKELQRLRKQKGMIQQDVADATGLHKQFISKIERGERGCTLENLNKIAGAIGCEVTITIDRQ